MNKKAIIISAFVGYEEFGRSRMMLSTSVNNTLLNLQNSSYPTRTHSIIVGNNAPLQVELKLILLKIITGAHRRTGTTAVQQTFRLKALYKHSGFTMQNLKHDIAVLQLEGSAQLSDKVTTVCLPEQDAALNSKCYITGLTLSLIKPK